MSTVVISEFDVLCGRDRLSHGHPGNRTFRKLVEESAASYQRSANRHQKTTIIQSIIRVIQEAGGRFLTLQDSFLTGNIAWREMEPQSMHQKVAHALRSKQTSTFTGSLRGGGLVDSCRSAGTVSAASKSSARSEEPRPSQERTTTKPSSSQRQTDLHFLDALVEQQDCLLQSLHISVEFSAKDVAGDESNDVDNQSQCSNASELTSSTSGTHDDDLFPLTDTEHHVSAEDERILLNNICDESSEASAFFFTLEGALAEF